MFIWKPKELIGKTFCFQEKSKTINRMFKVGLRRSFAEFLQFKKIFLHLFSIQIRGQTLKMQSHCCNMAAVIFKGFLTTSQNRNIPFKTMK